MLGYYESAVADAEHALKDAREIGQAATLMFALSLASFAHILCGNYETATAQIDEARGIGGGQGCPVLEGAGNVSARLAFCTHSQTR